MRESEYVCKFPVIFYLILDKSFSEVDGFQKDVLICDASKEQLSMLKSSVHFIRIIVLLKSFDMWVFML